jgi:hypothetical protein
MTYAAPDPVPSGRPYVVTAVAGEPPAALEQFLGETAFKIDKSGEESEICGLGSRNDSGVRFHEKDIVHDGKDVRVWQITPGRDGEFIATATAAF